MKNKTKLLMTIMSMCLVITLGVIGILAVKKLDLNIGGSVNFSAEGVALEVSAGKFYTDAGLTSEYTGLVSGKMQGFSIDTNISKSSIDDELATWSGLVLNLDERGDAYLHFTVKNNMTNTLYIALTVDNGTQDANKNIEILTIESVPSIAGSTAEAKDFVFHFDIKDTDVNASLTDFAIELDFKLIPDAIVNESGVITNLTGNQYTGVKYTLENGKVKIDGTGASGDVVIVDKVVIGGVPYDVTEVSASAFAHNQNIKSIVISEGIISIGVGAFNGCFSLESVILPEGIEIINSGTFNECSALKSIHIPSTVNKIMGFAFYGCANIETITGCAGVESIAFYDNFDGTKWFNKQEEGLVYLNDILIARKGYMSQSIIVKNGTRFISQNAFAACDDVVEITIPASVKLIDSCSFENCDNLEKINILAQTPPVVKDGKFWYFPTLTKIYIPNNSYLTADGWKDLNLTLA